MSRTFWMLMLVGLAASAAPARAQDPPSPFEWRLSPARFETPAEATAPAKPEARTALVWQVPTRRPGPLVPLYASFAAIQALEVYSTLSSLAAGGQEQNPVVGVFGKNAGAMLAFKAATTAGTIYAAERMWKKHRVGAVVLMVALNGVTAVMAARNMRVAQALRAR